MTVSKVYFTDFHHDVEDNFLEKFEKFIIKAGIGDIDYGKKFTAIKIHFGEYGNMAYLRPGYARTVASIVKEHGGMPFVTDCNTLYAGRRKNALEHLDTAAANGFNSVSLGCNIIIGDGLKGDDDVEIPVNGEYVKNAKIGRSIADADVIVTISHFKCHEMAGIGGALKNLAMGCASRRGKMEQHANGKVHVDKDKCIGCKRCTKMCAAEAISVKDKKATVNENKCTGCGLCIASCHYDAIDAVYGSKDAMCKKMAEYAKAATLNKPCFYINIIADVSPNCDCRASCELPIVPNVGILASTDPVAIDVACADLVNQQTVIPGSHADKEGPEDIFLRTNPDTDWKITTDHAEKIGMGSSKYELIKI